MTTRTRLDSGFTLLEVMSVLAIVSILAMLALVSHKRFVEKARSVEAEVALAEIERLETLYFASHGTYSGDLHAIGFSLAPSLRYYKVLVRLEKGGAAFHATAIPLLGDKMELTVVLSHTKDGTFLQKGGSASVADASGTVLDSSGTSSANPGAGGQDAMTGGNSTKADCRQGGEATVAEDGLLDMNFCLR